MNAKPIVIVGSINMDLVARTPRIPQAGETISGSDFVTTPGGKGANQAVAVARLGGKSRMLGMVGEDAFGFSMVDNLRLAGVDASAVRTATGPSGVAQIVVAGNGQNSIVVVPGANGKVDNAYIDVYADVIRSAGIVMLQLEIPLATIEHVLALCSEAKVPVMLDPAPGAPLPDSFFPQIAWFTPNETETTLYVGEGLAAEQAAPKLLAKGVHGVVLKRGAEGAYVATNGIAERVSAFKVEAIDTVAAGDSFNGAFAVALTQGKNPLAAVHFASAAAAISVTRRGAQASMPTLNEVEAFLQQNAI